ncbi:DinB family protein [Flavilitoribacter nigricans]|uniref:Damage-inducible protein DinB n=1 Tax=Flavilitoribacter nigricans (strain ATCC 23147 / DSM 23189 / NBRC 102662 / NCIMB 1420 / SS-2) TaxID=1122177 RepID=A0A2D0MZ44_FLAN2|nr:DinB family protein [Flavilitoribacter nigricans]PHN01159.1 damage-inducible protein DinB [Flavilitoribacter nigricans DSM 23189 = NBRC 102662]
MKAFFLDIFAYHHHFNLKLLEEITAHREQLPPGVYPMFCHCLNAHQIWNARILDGKPYGVQQLHEPDQCREIDTTNYAATLRIINEVPLDRPVEYQNSKGVKFRNSVQEILFHINNHHTHHRGQIVADFRRSGIAPLVTDYIFYKR